MTKMPVAISTDPRRMATVSARVTFQTKHALKSLAKTEGLPVSEMLHALILNRLAEKGLLPK